MASSAISVTATASAAVSVSTPSGTPAVVFQPIETLTACQTARIRWTNQNSFDWADESIALYVDNAGVNQAIPDASSTISSSSIVTSTSTVASSTTPRLTVTIRSSPPALPSTPPSSTSAAMVGVTFPLPSPVKRSSIPINETLEPSHQANVAYQWDSVNLPAGRYHIRAFANSALTNTGPSAGSVPRGGLLGTSADFTIVEDAGSTLCLDAAANKVLSDSVLAASQTRGSSSAASASASINASAGGSAGSEAATGQNGSSGKTSGGTIAGIVIGVLAGIALLAGLFFCWRKRRRQRSRYTQDGPHNFPEDNMGTSASASHTRNRLSSFGEPNPRVPIGSFESAEKYPQQTLHYTNPNGDEEVPMTAVLGKKRQGSDGSDGSSKEYLTPLPTAASSSFNELPMPSAISPFTSFADGHDGSPQLHNDVFSSTPSSGNETPITSRSRQPSLSNLPPGPGSPRKSSDGDMAGEVERSKSSGGMQRKPSIGRRKPVPLIEPGEAEMPRRPSAPVVGSPKVTDSKPQRKSYILTADPPASPR